MSHYSIEKWKSYKNDILKADEKIKMEDHLYNCDECMDVFIGLIDDQEIKLAEENIPSNFTRDIMKKIDTFVPIAKHDKKKKLIENMFMYYVAAASVILALTAGGIFTRITQIPIENMRLDIQGTPKGVEKFYNLSEKVANNTNNFINNFGIKQEGGKQYETKK